MDIYIITAGILFIYGIYALISKKNLIKSLIGLILMIESSHLIFISSSPLNALTQYFVIVSIVITGCLLAVIIGFILNIYKKTGTLNTKVLKSGDKNV